MKISGRSAAATLIVSIVIGGDELVGAVDRVRRDNFDLSPVTGTMLPINPIECLVFEN